MPPSWKEIFNWMVIHENCCGNISSPDLSDYEHVSLYTILFSFHLSFSFRETVFIAYHVLLCEHFSFYIFLHFEHFSSSSFFPQKFVAKLNGIFRICCDLIRSVENAAKDKTYYIWKANVIVNEIADFGLVGDRFYSLPSGDRIFVGRCEDIFQLITFSHHNLSEMFILLENWKGWAHNHFSGIKYILSQFTDKLN